MQSCPPLPARQGKLSKPQRLRARTMVGRRRQQRPRTPLKRATNSTLPRTWWVLRHFPQHYGNYRLTKYASPPGVDELFLQLAVDELREDWLTDGRENSAPADMLF